uniref:NADH-ubiquinone oxidoreductase chain 2 n=1 Tax=Sylvicola fenestralis TaxID=52754 RepID=G8J8K3_9DIPT
MLNNTAKILFLLTLIFGTLMSVSSNSWLGVWMGLEINLLSIIPLMIDNNKLMSTEASLKYFLTQALASSILLFSIFIMFLFNNIIFQLNLNLWMVSMMMTSALLLKSGAAPFHFWFPGVMEGLSWMNNLILMTWQKIAPLMVLSYIIFKPFLIYIIILSTIMGALGGLNQTSLRKLLAFSSINHLSWMIAALMFNESMWLFYFLMYSFLSFSLIFMFNSFKLYHINQTFSMFNNSPVLKFMIFTTFLSLGGLPPFIGFLPKWMLINSLISMNQIFILFIMVMMALITLFFYLRITYSAFMLNYSETNWNFKMNNKNINWYFSVFLSFISTFGLFIISLIFLIY